MWRTVVNKRMWSKKVHVCFKVWPEALMFFFPPPTITNMTINAIIERMVDK
jgi:hypothetical protein